VPAIPATGQAPDHGAMAAIAAFSAAPPADLAARHAGEGALGRSPVHCACYLSNMNFRC